MADAQAGPPSKRMKPESVAPKDDGTEQPVSELESDVDGDHCTICLQSFVDRTLVPTCSHEFCFECLMTWSGTYL
jgi:Ring finger domain